MQMDEYRRRNLSLTDIGTPKSPADPVPRPEGQAPPTRFKFERPTYRSQPSHQPSTVEAEYNKYTTHDLSSPATDIVKFWEVRFMLLDGAMTHPDRIGQQNRVSNVICNRHGLSPNPGHIRSL